MRDSINIVSSAAVISFLTAILTTTVFFVFREWISARLKGSIQHEYAEKLETLKAQIKAEHEVRILNISTKFEREASLQASAHGSFAEGQKAAMERRLAAIDRLWERILYLRGHLPSIIGLIDYLTVDEYKSEKYKPLILEFTEDPPRQRLGSILDQGGDQIERARPYVGEYMWSLFYCYEVM